MAERREEALTNQTEMLDDWRNVDRAKGSFSEEEYYRVLASQHNQGIALEQNIKSLTEQLNQRKDSLDQAYKDLIEAQSEFESTLVPVRVEGLRLKFEVYKLQATVSGAAVAGIAAVAAFLEYELRPWLLVLAAVILLISVFASLLAMRRIGQQIQSTLSTGKEAVGGFTNVAAAWTFPIGLAVFLVYVVLNQFPDTIQ